MAAPNIVSVTTITGKTAVGTATPTATSLVTNPAASGKVFKVNALYATNTEGTMTAGITVDIYRSSTAYNLTNDLVIPINSTLDILTKSIYLEEGDALRITTNSDTSGDVSVVCSYEEIS